MTSPYPSNSGVERWPQAGLPRCNRELQSSCPQHSQQNLRKAKEDPLGLFVGLFRLVMHKSHSGCLLMECLWGFTSKGSDLVRQELLRKHFLTSCLHLEAPPLCEAGPCHPLSTSHSHLGPRPLSQLPTAAHIFPTVFLREIKTGNSVCPRVCNGQVSDLIWQWGRL